MMKVVVRMIHGSMRWVNRAFPLAPGVAPMAWKPFKQGMTFRPRFANEWFMALGLWEPYVLSTLTFSPGDVFIDIGAHIGYFTCLAARAVGPTGSVLAIEADPRNVSVLADNTRAFQNVIIVPKVCDRAEGLSRIIPESNPLFTKVNNLEGTQVVETTTLDAAARLLPRIALQGQRRYWVKIDIEGKEIDALAGGAAFIDSFKPDIILESFPESARMLREVLPKYEIHQIAESYYHLFFPRMRSGDQNCHIEGADSVAGIRTSEKW